MPTINKFQGINNVEVDPELARTGHLQVATNVIIDNGGNLRRRRAFVSQNAIAAYGAVVAGSEILTVVGTDIVAYDTSNGQHSVVYSSVTDSLPFKGVELNGSVYVSNGTVALVRKSDGSFRSSGLAAPPAITLSSGIGDLVDGYYQVGVTYVRSDGQESAPAVSQPFMVKNGGISVTVTASADPDVIAMSVYVTGVDSPVTAEGVGLMRYSLNSNSTGTITVGNRSSVGAGTRCTTFGTSPTPAGSIAFFYRGRMYVVVGNVLWYSRRFMYENFAHDRDGIVMPSNITMAVPVADGIWLGTEDEHVFLAGKDPENEGGFQMIARTAGKATCGVQTNSTIVARPRMYPGACAIFLTGMGVMLGEGNGTLTPITTGVWQPTDLTEVFAVVDNRKNMPQYVFRTGDGTFSMNLTNGSVCQSDRQHSAMCSYGGVMFAVDGTAVFSDEQDTDNDTASDDSPTPVAWTVTKNGITFGNNNLKHVSDIYLAAKSESVFTITIGSSGVSGSVQTQTPVQLPVDLIRLHKVDAPRGLRGRSFSISLSDASGADFVLNSIVMEVMVSETRRGRQNVG